jgi:hypothetical protein
LIVFAITNTNEGYEERLCRRSTLAATLSTPGPESTYSTNYPMTAYGGIYSESVVVFRGLHETYKVLPEDEWADLPIISMPAVRWPKLKSNGTKYAFSAEREMVKNKLIAALRICIYYRYRDVVIGDFNLGNSYRNPPQELAELWREVFLYEPDIRGWFNCVAFVFEDGSQSTTQLIQDEIDKKDKKDKKHSSSSFSHGKSKGKGKSNSSSASSATAGGNSGCPTDFEIFSSVFDPTTINEVLGRPDPRYGISMLTE